MCACINAGKQIRVQAARMDAFVHVKLVWPAAALCCVLAAAAARTGRQCGKSYFAFGNAGQYMAL